MLNRPSQLLSVLLKLEQALAPQCPGLGTRGQRFDGTLQRGRLRGQCIQVACEGLPRIGARRRSIELQLNERRELTSPGVGSLWSAHRSSVVELKRGSSTHKIGPSNLDVTSIRFSCVVAVQERFKQVQ